MRLILKCTQDNPYSADRAKKESLSRPFWQHSEAKEIGDYEDGWPGGDIVQMECQTCGVRWKKELPQ